MADLADCWHVTLPGGQLNPILRDDVFNRVQTAALAMVDRETWRQCAVVADYSSPFYFDTDMWEILGTDWIVQKGITAGTFPKRLRKYLNVILPEKLAAMDGQDGRANMRPWHELKIRFPDSFFAQLGADLGPIVNAGKTYYCDLVRRIRWHAGDFGDEGSCYWKQDSYYHARGSLEATGRFFALRFFTEQGGGYGRCWGLHYDDGIALFNAYGVPLITCARILSHITGMSYAPTSFRYDSNAIFVNCLSHHGGAFDRGIVLHSSNEAPEYLDLDVDYVAHADCRCSSCSEDADACSDCGGDCSYCEICERNMCECVGCCQTCQCRNCECCGDCRAAPDNCTCVDCPLCDRRYNDCYCFDDHVSWTLNQWEWEHAIRWLYFPVWRAWAIFACDLDLAMGQLRFTVGGFYYANAA